MEVCAPFRALHAGVTSESVEGRLVGWARDIEPSRGGAPIGGVRRDQGSNPSFIAAADTEG